MDYLTTLVHGLGEGLITAIGWQNLLLALIGCFLGTLFGALPGLGPANGVAILIPLAFNFDLNATAAMILLSSVYYGAMYGGRISAILLNIPGDAPAIMTTLDGYPMSRRGQAGEALALSGIACFVGSLFSTIALVLFAPLLMKVAILFGPAEYFALFCMAFSFLGGVGNQQQSKVFLATLLGLAIGVVGIDRSTGIARYTYGSLHVLDGIDFLIAVVGLFALSEVLQSVEFPQQGEGKWTKVRRITAPWSMIRSCGKAMARGTGIGFLAGVLPGAGASLGSYLAYTFERKFSDKERTFGKGDPRGLAAPEAGNNAAAGGALVPMLSLGVPGSGTTAVMLGTLLALNVTPGPLLLQSNPDVFWGLAAALFLANILLLLLNIPFVGIFSQLLRIPARYLMPFIVIVSFVGIYSLSGSLFDLFLLIVFALGGWLLRKVGVPLLPIVLGILLGPKMEENLRLALISSNGSWSILIASPLTAGLWTLTIATALLPTFKRLRRR